MVKILIPDRDVQSSHYLCVSVAAAMTKQICICIELQPDVVKLISIPFIVSMWKICLE